MKTLLVPLLAITLLPSAAAAQSCVGEIIPGQDRLGPCPHNNSNANPTGNNANFTNNRRDVGESTGPSEESQADIQRRAAAFERAEFQRKLKNFQRVLNRQNKGYTEQVKQDWYNLFMRDGWGASYYNYALAAWRLGDVAEAEDAFQRIVNGCRSGTFPPVRPGMPYDPKICVNAEANVSAIQQGRNIAFQEQQGDNFFNMGNFDAAERAYLAALRLGDASPLVYYNLANTYTAEHRWADAYAYAKMACEHTADGCPSPNTPEYTARFYHTWENLEYAYAEQEIKQAADANKLPLDQITDHLRNAIRYDIVLGKPQYKARVMLAYILHSQGNNTPAETEADIALLQSPGENPDVSAAQLVLDQIHYNELLAAKQARDADCHEHTPLFTCISPLGHWPNACNTITPNAQFPDDARFLGCTGAGGTSAATPQPQPQAATPPQTATQPTPAPQSQTAEKPMDPNSSHWLIQPDGTAWRLYHDEQSHRHCEVKHTDGTITEVDCAQSFRYQHKSPE